MFLCSKVDQEEAYLLVTHFGRMAFFMEENVPFDPMHVGLLGTVGIVFQAQLFPDQVEEFFFLAPPREAVREVVWVFQGGLPGPGEYAPLPPALLLVHGQKTSSP